MKKTYPFFLFILIVFSCKKEIKKDLVTPPNPSYKIPVYAWAILPENKTDNELKSQFKSLKNKGIDGLMYSAGHDPLIYKRVGKIAKQAGMKFHAWIPTMIQYTNPKLKPEWYAINGKGESAFDKPAYVSHYQFLCPSKPEVHDFLVNLYQSIADIEEVDGIHLDYIRFPDVILAKGLWKKYNLVMDKEYPQFDYCYCDTCAHDFKSLSDIDIKKVKEPSQLQEWKQFRYDLITNLVNKLADSVHQKNKVINAAVFPGPHSIAKKLVRQEWDKWNLDAFYPMNYNDFYLGDTSWIGKLTKEEVSSINAKKPIYSGLFICPKPKNKSQETDPENHGLLPEELEAAIKESMVNGASGICLFTPDRMTEAHWEVFQKAIYTDYTKTTSRY
ncbi:family 10 glycosylhydrolase [Aquimarina sp. 2201CG1-2-11]|uniref:family 10 glycosylhydrolase n=1 Tax=Aquimarina discodermiae TaxID=3231043 RepID=UPI003461B092